MKFITDTFEGSQLSNHVANAGKRTLESHLSGAKSAMEYHKKEGNRCQVKFFSEAIVWLEKKLRVPADQRTQIDKIS